MTTAARIETPIAGIRPPRRLPLYDCRSAEDAPTERTSWGESLYAGERAAVALGLRSGWDYTERHDAFTPSLSTYHDTRQEDGARRALRYLRSMAAEALMEWRRATRKHTGRVLGVTYKPVAVTLANYGGGVLRDMRQTATKHD